MTTKPKRIRTALKARASEPSTYAGIGILATVAASATQAFGVTGSRTAAAIAGLSALAAMFMPERKSQ